MRIENVFCEQCGVVHYVQIMQRDRRGLIVKTKCLGKDFVPIESSPAVDTSQYYIRHRMRGYEIIRKAKNTPKAKMVTTFKRQPLIVEPVIQENRVCVAQISMFARGKYVTIKVFEDATPEKFYEFFSEIGDKPEMIRTRNLGRDKAVHISDIPHIYKIEGKVNLVYHNRQKYESLLAYDPASMAAIIERNSIVVAGTHGG